MKNKIVSKKGDIKNHDGFLGLKNIVYPEMCPPERRQNTFQNSNERTESQALDPTLPGKYDTIKSENNKPASLKRFMLGTLLGFKQDKA